MGSKDTLPSVPQPPLSLQLFILTVCHRLFHQGSLVKDSWPHLPQFLALYHPHVIPSKELLKRGIAEFILVSQGPQWWASCRFPLNGNWSDERKANPKSHGDPEEWPLTLPSWQKQKGTAPSIESWQIFILGEGGVERGAQRGRFELKPEGQLVCGETSCFMQWNVGTEGQGMKIKPWQSVSYNEEFRLKSQSEASNREF